LPSDFTQEEEKSDKKLGTLERKRHFSQGKPLRTPEPKPTHCIYGLRKRRLKSVVIAGKGIRGKGGVFNAGERGTGGKCSMEEP